MTGGTMLLMFMDDSPPVLPPPPDVDPPMHEASFTLKRSPWEAGATVGVYERLDEFAARQGGAPSLTPIMSVLATVGNTVVVPTGLAPGARYWLVGQDPELRWRYIAITADEV